MPTWMPNGFHGLNVAVNARLRGWAFDTAKALCADPDRTDDPQMRATLYNNAGWGGLLKDARDTDGAPTKTPPPATTSSGKSCTT